MIITNTCNNYCKKSVTITVSDSGGGGDLGNRLDQKTKADILHRMSNGADIHNGIQVPTAQQETAG